MEAGESLLIVVTTEILVSYVVSGTEDSLADCHHGTKSKIAVDNVAFLVISHRQTNFQVSEMIDL